MLTQLLKQDWIFLVSDLLTCVNQSCAKEWKQASSRRGSRRAILCTYAPSTSLEKNCTVYQLSIHSSHARTVRHWLYHQERVLIS